ncbi:MAG: hypothetical protein M1450_02615 [Patescibacteria group bacterium]|nr:hypothetical protein [Patescibacteria group bacterium]
MERLFIQPGVDFQVFMKSGHVEPGSEMVGKENPNPPSDLEIGRHKAMCSQEIPRDQIGKLVTEEVKAIPDNGWGDNLPYLSPEEKLNAWQFFLYGALKKFEEQGMTMDEINNHLKTYTEASEKEKTGQEGK